MNCFYRMISSSEFCSRRVPVLPQKHEHKQGRISRGIHRLPRVSLGPTMPNPSKPCERPPLKQPYGRFRGGRLSTPLDTPRRTPLNISRNVTIDGVDHMIDFVGSGAPAKCVAHLQRLFDADAKCFTNNCSFAGVYQPPFSNQKKFYAVSVGLTTTIVVVVVVAALSSRESTRRPPGKTAPPPPDPLT
jgi:hypothetical protein